MKKTVVTKEQIKEMILSGELIKILHQNHAPAKNPPELSTSVYPTSMEYDLSPFLIKIDNHYVPANYIFYSDTGKEKVQYISDKNASLPTIDFDNSSGKYVVTFDAPDIGGYDVELFTWYFDSEEDINKEMWRG